MDFKEFMNLYKNVLQNHIFSVIDTSPALDNPLHFRKNIKNNHEN